MNGENIFDGCGLENSELRYALSILLARTYQDACKINDAIAGFDEDAIIRLKAQRDNIDKAIEITKIRIGIIQVMKMMGWSDLDIDAGIGQEPMQSFIGTIDEFHVFMNYWRNKLNLSGGVV